MTREGTPIRTGFASKVGVVRDRWPNQDGDRHIVSTSDIYAIYRALVDQVEEVA